MFRRRLAGYTELGYRIELPPADPGSILFGTDADKNSDADACGVADAFAAPLHLRPP